MQPLKMREIWQEIENKMIKKERSESSFSTGDKIKKAFQGFSPHKTVFPAAAVTAASTALITLIWHIVIRFCRVMDFVLNSGPSHKLQEYVSLSHYFTISLLTLFIISCSSHFSAIFTLNGPSFPSDTERKSMIK